MGVQQPATRPATFQKICYDCKNISNFSALSLHKFIPFFWTSGTPLIFQISILSDI